MRKCSECSAECCKEKVAYSFQNVDPRWIYPSVFINKTTEELMNISHSEYLRLGLIEVETKPTASKKFCASFDAEKQTCGDYLNRPLLCKSYYCHGKYFKRRESTL
jgi:Fe-S-cluster containining protein